jgi:hypothetical protein
LLRLGHRDHFALPSYLLLEQVVVFSKFVVFLFDLQMVLDLLRRIIMTNVQLTLLPQSFNLGFQAFLLVTEFFQSPDHLLQFRLAFARDKFEGANIAPELVTLLQPSLEASSFALDLLVFQPHQLIRLLTQLSLLRPQKVTFSLKLVQLTLLLPNFLLPLILK